MAGPLSTLITASILAGFAAMAAAQGTHDVAVGGSYTYVRTNVLPGCSCFSLNGGALQVQVGLARRYALLGDLTIAHKSGITQDQYSLTQYTYTGGVRFFPVGAGARVRPFGEVMLGGAGTTGTLSPARSGIGGSGNAFAFQTGGGLTLRVAPRLELIPFQAGYLLTTFANGADNRQNDLRLSGGVLIRLGR